MPRTSTGKRLRFEIFKRDHFTCQYCGAQPPDVVLVADHITPVASGGQTTIDNLITACEACNQGKADRHLTARQVRPDADLLYLETQQELAELRRYQEAKVERDALLDDIACTLEEDFWQVSRRDWAVADRVIRPLLDRYEPVIVERALRAVGFRIADGRVNTQWQAWVAYLNAVARNMAQDADEE
jgi:HNH endonuclease